MNRLNDIAPVRPRAAGGDDREKDNDGDGGDGGPDTGVVVKPKPKTKKTSMYKVIMLNDVTKKRPELCCTFIRKVSECAVSSPTKSRKQK